MSSSIDSNQFIRSFPSSFTTFGYINIRRTIAFSASEKFNTTLLGADVRQVLSRMTLAALSASSLRLDETVAEGPVIEIGWTFSDESPYQ